MMKTLLRSVLVLLAVMALAAGLAALLIWQLAPLPGTLTIDGETIALQGLGDLDGAHAALGVAIGTVAVLGAVLAALVAVVVGLAAAVIGIGIAFAAVAGSLLLAASPFLFVAFLVWLAVRRKPAPPLAGAGA